MKRVRALRFFTSADAFNDPTPWVLHNASLGDDDPLVELTNDQVDAILKQQHKRRAVQYANGEYFQYLRECQWVAKPVKNLGKICRRTK